MNTKKFVANRFLFAKPLVAYRGTRWTIIIWKRLGGGRRFYKNNVSIHLGLGPIRVFRCFKKREPKWDEVLPNPRTIGDKIPYDHDRFMKEYQQEPPPKKRCGVTWVAALPGNNELCWCVEIRGHSGDHPCSCGQVLLDREPRTSDGPDYHAEHRAWEERQRK